MGMFDSLYDEHDNEWQTKAFARNLDRFEIGDKIRFEIDTFQVEVLGEPEELGVFVDAFATVQDGTLRYVGVPRDSSLPHVDYSGHIVNDEDGA